MTLLLILATALLAFVFRVILHHERLWHTRRMISTHGTRRAFYDDARGPSSWFLPDEGVTT